MSIRDCCGTDCWTTATELAITGAHTVSVDLLPTIHEDPFDRMLIAQAQFERPTLLIADEKPGHYLGSIQVV